MAVKQGGTIFDFGNSSIPSTSVYTLCGFFWHNGTTGHNFGYFDMAMGAIADGNFIYHPDTGSATAVSLANFTAGEFPFSQPMLLNRWMFVAYSQRSTTDYTAYLKPVGQPGFTPAQRNRQTATTLAIDRFEAGCIQFASGDGFPGYVSHVKFWNGRALSEEQLNIESQQLRPAHAGIYSYVPLYNGLLDMSGLGHNYTTDGTNTFPQFEPYLPLYAQEPATMQLLMRAKAPAVVGGALAWMPCSGVFGERPPLVIQG